MEKVYPRSAREALLYPLAPVAHMVERVREIIIEKHGDLKLVVGPHASRWKLGCEDHEQLIRRHVSTSSLHRASSSATRDTQLITHTSRSPPMPGVAAKHWQRCC